LPNPVTGPPVSLLSDGNYTQERDLKRCVFMRKEWFTGAEIRRFYFILREAGRASFPHFSCKSTLFTVIPGYEGLTLV